MKLKDILEKLFYDVQFKVKAVDKNQNDVCEGNAIQLGLYNMVDEFTAQFLNNQVVGIDVNEDIIIIIVEIND